MSTVTFDPTKLAADALAAIDHYIAQLATATSAATAGQPARDMAADLTTAIGHYALFPYSTDDVKSRNLIAGMVKRMTADRDALAAKGVADRTEGDGIAAMLKAVTLMAQSDEQSERVAKAIGAWDATAPKGKRVPGTRNEKGAGTPIQVQCGYCSKVFTDRNNANSGHWSFMKHLTTAHAFSGNGADGRPDKDHPAYQATRDAWTLTAKDHREHTTGETTSPDGKVATHRVFIEPGWVAPTATPDAPTPDAPKAEDKPAA